jgi:hypothetical protein
VCDATVCGSCADKDISDRQDYCDHIFGVLSFKDRIFQTSHPLMESYQKAPSLCPIFSGDFCALGYFFK